MRYERLLAALILLLLTWEAAGCVDASVPAAAVEEEPPTISVVEIEEETPEKEVETPEVPFEDPIEEEPVQEQSVEEAPAQEVVAEKNPFEEVAPVHEKVVPTLADLSEGDTLWLQESLKVVGLYTPRDGLFGPDTRQKLKTFQRAEGDLEVTGALDEKTRYRLEGYREKRRPPAEGTIRVLVNKSYDLPAHAAPQVAKPDIRMLSDMRVAAVMVEDLERLFADAKAAGHHLAMLSGYRTYAYQESLFRRAVARDGLEVASSHTAIPGRSEHQTGLAVDLTSPEVEDGLTRRFGNTDAYAWLVENCHAYGFILRYPEGETESTGYMYEPWHYRYIGDPQVARKIMTEGWTYEEYFESHPEFFQ